MNEPELDVERVLDRVSSLRVAIIAGFCAVGAALLGGAIGAGGVILAAHVTADSKAQENRTTFVREQQQASYVKAVEDVRVLETLEEGCGVAQGGLTMESLQDALAVIEADRAVVELIGTADGYYKFDNLVATHSDIVGACIAGQSIKDLTAQGTQNMTDFVAQARTDVQGPR